jgi:hypothetical protein
MGHRGLITGPVSSSSFLECCNDLTRSVGYCDAQCARDLKYIDGKANAEGWKASTTDPNAGIGKKGACWYVDFYLAAIHAEVAAPKWMSGKPTPSLPP